MGIRRFFNQEIIVKRLKTSSGDKQRFSSTATVEGHIQELDERSRGKLDVVADKVFKAWFPVDTDIHEGDKIVDNFGVTYDVVEVILKTYGINDHLQAIISVTARS